MRSALLFVIVSIGFASACGEDGALAPHPGPPGKADYPCLHDACAVCEERPEFSVPDGMDWKAFEEALAQIKTSLADTDAAGGVFYDFIEVAGSDCFEEIVAKANDPSDHPARSFDAVESFDFDGELAPLTAVLRRGMKTGTLQRAAFFDLSADKDVDLELFLLDANGQIHYLSFYFDCERSDLDSNNAWTPSDRRLCR